MRFYLAGPVGYGNPGTEWKYDIKQLLRERGHEVYDPIENDDNYSEVVTMNEMKKSPEIHCQKIREIMQRIFRDDCEFISTCDYIVCYFANRGLGTSSEQGIAYYLNNFLNNKIQTISIFDPNFRPEEWTLCCSDHIFFNLPETINFLKDIA
jgi:nucleoside 2-deoxyribosyltransferase